MGYKKGRRLVKANEVHVYSKRKWDYGKPFYKNGSYWLYIYPKSFGKIKYDWVNTR